MIRKYSKILLFLVLSIYLLQNVFKIKASLFGDSIEYALMTEGFYRHGTPDLRVGDLQSFKSFYSEYNSWEGGAKEWTESISHFVQNSYVPLQLSWGYGTAINKKKYSQHFWFYPLINVLARALTGLIKIDPLKSFQITNSILILLVVFYLLFKSRLEEFRRLLLAFLFVFSSVFWYIIWPHPEVFAAIGVFMGLVFYFEEKYYLGLLAASLATMHNPPIVLLVGFIALKCLLVRGFNIKNIGLIFLSSIACVVPTLFYYYNFHVPNLIIEAGFLKAKYYTFTRFFGFFFDLNQGMVLSIPLLMFIFLAIYAKRLINIKNYNYNMLILPVIIGMTVLSMTMGNWNMGEAIVIRYAVWISMVIIVYTVGTFPLKKIYQKVILVSAIAIQPYVIFAYGGFEVPGWMYVAHYPIPVWVLSNHPSWYNPDPEIFAERTLNREGFSEKDSVIAFKSPEGDITKLMVHRNEVSSLSSEMRGDIDASKLRYVNDWAYINKK